MPLEVCRGEKDPHPMLLVTKEAKKAHERPLMRTEGVVKDDPSSALSRVKAFLPGMAAAEQELRVRMEVMGEEERRRAIQVDHVDESCGDAYVEMNVGLVEKGREADWSSDSDPDSPPSPPREGQDNEFTSDSDSDSTIRSVRELRVVANLEVLHALVLTEEILFIPPALLLAARPLTRSMAAEGPGSLPPRRGDSPTSIPGRGRC